MLRHAVATEDEMICTGRFRFSCWKLARKLAWRSNNRRDLEGGAGKLLFAINAGMFDPNLELRERKLFGAVRYQELGDDGAPAFAPQVGTLYIRKSAMPGGKIPKTLTVTIASE
jgi:hypothetical protein